MNRRNFFAAGFLFGMLLGVAAGINVGSGCDLFSDPRNAASCRANVGE